MARNLNATQLRNVDALLDRLVERAHDLVGTDVTYLSEFYPGNSELRVRTTLGTHSRAFRELRVPPSMGLASMVVENRGPELVNRYSDLAPALRDERIDAAVAEEGLVSILGVPLLAGEEVIGVLFAANRVEHAFNPHEISLLSAFADHAAVVLQTARLLTQTQQAHNEARETLDALSRHLEAMERASEVHENLTAIVLRGGTRADVAEALGEALRCRVLATDDRLGQAVGGPGADDGALRNDVHVAIGDSRSSGHCVVLPTHQGRHRAVVAVVAGSSMLGALLLEDGTVPFGPVERRTAERAAQITALLALKQDAVIDAELRVQRDILADLLAEDRFRHHEVRTRASARKIELDQLRVIVVTAVGREHHRAALTAAGHAAGPRGLAGEYAGRIVVLTPIAEAASAARAVHESIGRALRSSVLSVAAELTGDWGGIRNQFAAAEGVLRVLPVLGLRDVAVTADEYLPYAALFGPDTERLDSFVEATIGTILRWDQARGGQLLPTLALYLDNRLSPVATARALHLHKNTVLQRVERITELLGDGWQGADTLFRISVAVRISMLRAAQ